MIEVMIALGVMAVGLSAVLSHQFTLDNLRATSLSRALQTIAVNNLVNLADGTNWDELGRAQRPWSLSRVQGADNTNQPLSLDNLVTYGLVGKETGHLHGGEAVDRSIGTYRFYLEYYRSTANLDSARAPLTDQPGLLDAPVGSSAAFKTSFTANAASCRIVPDPTLGLADPTKLTQGNPVLMRIAVARVDPLTNAERTTYETFLGSQTAPQ